VLRHALRRGNARLFLEWSERWRATVLRVSPVRPPADSALVADLAALRNVAARLDGVPASRSATLTMQRERRRLEALVRQRVLQTPALAAGNAEPFVTADLLEQLGDTDLLELTDVDGQLYAVVLTGKRLPAAGSSGVTCPKSVAASRQTCLASRYACFAAARWSWCQPESCTLSRGA
jgi:hypothetical protein